MEIRKNQLHYARNFLDLYLYHVGEMEVPRDFHIWSAISLMAACVGNRVWYEKFKGSGDRLFPNLYVMLLAPSGIGKNKAIGIATKYIQTLDIIGFYRGKVTSAALHDILASARPVNGEFVIDPRLYLVTPELTYSVGSGPLADDFIKFMTERFTGDEGEHKETTRSRGSRSMIDPCINWLSGSTPDWMLESVAPSAISGGFFARVIVVKSDYNLDHRVHQPVVPWDFKEIQEHLASRIYYMAQVTGGFTMSEAAFNIEKNWYITREAPKDESLLPIWQREQDIIYKVAMLLALADMVLWESPSAPLIIGAPHMEQAMALITSVRMGIEEIVNLSSATKDTEAYQRVKRIIQKAETIQHSSLLRKVSSQGVDAWTLKKAITTLEESKQITIKATQSGRGIVYTWISARMMK